MLKYIILFGLIFLLTVSAKINTYLTHRDDAVRQLEYSQRMMSERVTPFVQKWALVDVPLTFGRKAVIGEIPQILARLKREVGFCRMSYIGICRSADDKVRFPTDQYATSFGASIRCPFELSCDKMSLSGTAVFLPEESLTRLYKLILTYLPPRKEVPFFPVKDLFF